MRTLKIGDTVEHTNSHRVGKVREVRQMRDGSTEMRVDIDFDDIWWNSQHVRNLTAEQEFDGVSASAPGRALKLSDKHREDLQKYVDYYKGKEEIYGDKGWPISIAYAIEAALARIDELESQITTRG